ncbi:hypothetical protein L7F22_047648 [Adiantum nelumboides]|nr:hypothetical protein [Adiantum nelumboides]
MAPLDRKEVEDMIARAITQAKKEADKALNAEVRKMSEKMKQMEDSIKGLTEEKDAWKKAFEELQEGINHLRISKEEGEISSFEDIEVEIKNKWKADIKEEIQTEMEAKQSGWVEVVKKNIKKEVCEEVHMGEHLRVQLTLEEERLRHLRKHNVRITNLKEGPSAEEDARELCSQLGYKETMPFTKAWRAGRDTTRARPLIMQLRGDEDRSTFFRKRVLLRGLQGGHIFMDEDLTRMQIEHRKSCMPKVLQARKEGKKAFFRDGRVFIDGRPVS